MPYKQELTRTPMNIEPMLKYIVCMKTRHKGAKQTEDLRVVERILLARSLESSRRHGGERGERVGGGQDANRTRK
jgi:hypothetical protein